MGVLVTKTTAAQEERDEFLQSLREDAEDWAAGRSWLIRLPLLVYLAYAFVRHLRDPLYGSIFAGIILGIHELGHVIFGFAGTFISVAGGTIAQMAAPIAAGFIFLRQRDYFGISVAGMWLSYSLFNSATYISDAQEMELPLVGVGTGEPIHDWNFMLDKLGLLQLDNGLGGFTRFIAFLIGAASLALAAWLCLVMYRSRKG